MQLALHAALLNPQIVADSVSIIEYPELARRYSVMGVPKTVINDKIEFVGAIPEAAFIEQLLAASES